MRGIWQIILTLLAVVLATRAGGEFTFPPTNISTFWPANAILLAALLLMDKRLRLLCLLLAYPAYAAAEFWIGFAIADGLVFALANCLEVGLAYALIQRFAEIPIGLTKLRQVLVLFAAGAVGSLVGGIVGAGGAALSGAAFAEVFLRWFLADLLGVLVFCPLVLTLPAWRDWLASASPLSRLEALATTAAILLLSVVTYGTSNLAENGLQGAHFLPIPVMLWAALRLGPKGAAVASFAVSVVAHSLAIRGFGPFANLSPQENVESLQLFVASLVLATTLVAVLGQERDAALSRMARSLDDLETTVAERTAALRDSEGQFRDFARASADRFWEMGPDLRFNWFDKADPFDDIVPIKRTIGKTRWEVAGSDPDDDEMWRGHREDLEARRPFTNFEFCTKGTDGGEHWWRVSGVPVFDSDADFKGYRGIASNITEHKQMESQLHHAQRMEAIGRLAGGIAHDFNNILAVQLGNAELLEGSSGLGAQVRGAIAAIKQAVSRGSSLTARLLAISRQQTLHPVSVDVSGLISGLEDMLRRTLGARVDLTFVHGSGLWPVSVDPHQFENALINLAINARDAMPKGGSLVFDAANETVTGNHDKHDGGAIPGDYVRIAVRDEGEGIPPEVLDHIFEPFFTTKEVGEGSGLGLSMVYGFAKQSNGFTTVTSNVGDGTTVTLYLPRSTSLAAPDQKDAAAAPPDSAGGSERILVVEDDAEVRAFPTRVLRDKGYDVVEAENGAQATESLRSGRPFDLLFTDIILPGGMNGVEIAAEAKRLQPNIKILYATGYADSASVTLNLSEPGTAILYKPYRLADLLGQVRDLLEADLRTS